MTPDVLDKLTRRGDTSKQAAGYRLRAARISLGKGQEELARDMQSGMTKQKMRNAEAGRNYPGIEVMQYLWRRHRIDMTFILHGDYAHLAGDVQERLFSALQAVTSELDQGQGSADPSEREP